MEDFSAVSWLAVGTGTVVAFLVGWAWYGPFLFGKKWAEGSGVELGTAQSMPVFAMVSQLVGLFLLSLVIGLTATMDALMTAMLAILAMAVFVVSMGAFVKKTNYALVVDGGYIIVSGIVMILAQAIF
ncbi:DUF1761 domain-containing protein [Saccharospirillum salsuginis]|uniref:DUF1761 domain-containing protein n=1 Tax=Saccharospirillum salsuginis TaxID=418750 RepID=A0A918KDZ2_9GAMM|nr:DUF1761 domain-containing protein [Saccharospirillum salsuginis]GGX59299.1 hypothetical protein GCM10007392_28920 [Saccharospirillum salsuginis]